MQFKKQIDDELLHNLIIVGAYYVEAGQQFNGWRADFTQDLMRISDNLVDDLEADIWNIFYLSKAAVVGTKHIKEGTRRFIDWSERLFEPLGQNERDLLSQHLKELHKISVQRANKETEKSQLLLSSRKAILRFLISQNKQVSSRWLFRKQKAVVLTGVFFVLLTGLFPPWKYVHPGGNFFNAERLAGYSFFITGPSIDPKKMEATFDVQSENLVKQTRLEIEALEKRKNELQTSLDRILPQGFVSTDAVPFIKSNVDETSSDLADSLKGRPQNTLSTITPRYSSDVQRVQDVLIRIKELERDISDKEALISDNPYLYSVKLDVTRFTAQLLTIILITIGLAWVMRD